ncbi:hypothetical protein HMI55_001904 [Coelomomyces lativittatus]|nr:hypothetical protein HMI55_001904 [Coelomomyces lativittatus]
MSRWGLLVSYLGQVFFLFLLTVPVLFFFITRYLVPPFPATSGFTTSVPWVLAQNIAVSFIFLTMLVIQVH